MVGTGLRRPSPSRDRGCGGAGVKGSGVGGCLRGRCGLRLRRRCGVGWGSRGVGRVVASAGLGEAGVLGSRRKVRSNGRVQDDADGAVGVDEGGAEAVVVLAALAGLDGDDGIQALPGVKRVGLWAGSRGSRRLGLVRMRGSVIGERRAGRGPGGGLKVRRLQDVGIDALLTQAVPPGSRAAGSSLASASASSR